MSPIQHECGASMSEKLKDLRAGRSVSRELSASENSSQELIEENEPARVDPLALLAAADKIDAAKHRESESLKLGNLRAGNTGILLEENGKVYIAGKCHRTAFLRMRGIEIEEIPENRQLMFAAGHGNETLWLEKLQQTWTGDIKCEEEIPIEWKTANGTNVTGRPDLVLGWTKFNPEKQFAPKHGLEFKLVSSLWTARDVLNGHPKPAHVMQAAHYMWKLGAPFDLMYTSRADFAISGDWVQKLFPAKGSGHSAVRHIEYSDKDDKPKKVLPFNKMFPLKLRKDGVVFYKDGDAPWQETIVSSAGIQAFFEFISTMDARKDLGPRPQNLDVLGNKKKYTLCKYCPLAKHCDKYEKEGLDEWLRNVPNIQPSTLNKESLKEG